MRTMKFIFINGPSCAGKTTIINGLHDAKERYYYLCSDKLKWQISKYDSAIHFNDVRALSYGLAETLCRMEYNILCDSALYKEFRDKLKTLAEKHQYDFIEINLEADYDVLAARFAERLLRAKADPGNKVSNRSAERHRELYDIYMANRNPDAITFRTDKQTPQEIIDEIIKLM